MTDGPQPWCVGGLLHDQRPAVREPGRRSRLFGWFRASGRLTGNCGFGFAFSREPVRRRRDERAGRRQDARCEIGGLKHSPFASPSLCGSHLSLSSASRYLGLRLSCRYLDLELVGPILTATSAAGRAVAGFCYRGLGWADLAWWPGMMAFGEPFFSLGQRLMFDFFSVFAAFSQLYSRLRMRTRTGALCRRLLTGIHHSMLHCDTKSFNLAHERFSQNRTSGRDCSSSSPHLDTPMSLPLSLHFTATSITTMRDVSQQPPIHAPCTGHLRRQKVCPSVQQAQQYTRHSRCQPKKPRPSPLPSACPQPASLYALAGLSCLPAQAFEQQPSQKT
ncbi:hypothetical protein IWZ00DRAFT_288225 [Phyllosticta capitalensis]|uniref:uncharacterized protein n=1 Tax=Phyllosticta capitalensis TaxID=121624 RepID=UPI00312F8EB3